MNTIPLILGIVGTLGLGAMSPGPSFLLVARTAVSSSRIDGVATALGMGVGGVIFAVIALLGLHVLLTAIPWLYVVMKVVGGLYLMYLGYCIWRGANKPLSMSIPSAVSLSRTIFRSFRIGLVTQLSNPKTAIVYASVFTAFLPPVFPLSLALILVVLVFAVEAGWYIIVALALSSKGPQNFYLRYKAWLDRAAGAVMAFLGVKLAWLASNL
ncbi:LysE family transporter [Actimicrobium sp. CCC2.4]|uniref:LysE family transporter n=1 Tax=Actimicrobium sp. CCC2.4 TaxID=3048606 RepID=UPI002AC93C10|nr:LysE family transporter [Actimicrobium sp. CCC2.4]MEB0133763.1 LysE family transporter [Actimicrobium sp. CCC2.4]WPX31307.1 LysE family transporter [Actimicrobium sp. CCC2.4]